MPKITEIPEIALDFPSRELKEIRSRKKNQTVFKQSLDSTYKILVRNGVSEEGVKLITNSLMEASNHMSFFPEKDDMMSIYRKNKKYMERSINHFSIKLRKYLIESRKYPWGTGSALNDKRVYEAFLRLARKAGKTDKLDASQRGLVVLSGLSRKSVAASIKRLAKNNWIEQTQPGGIEKSAEYSIKSAGKPLDDAPYVQSISDEKIQSVLMQAMDIQIQNRRTRKGQKPLVVDARKVLDLEGISKAKLIKIMQIKPNKKETWSIVLRIKKGIILKLRRNINLVESSGAKAIQDRDWLLFPPIHGHHDAFQAKCFGSLGLSIYELIATSKKGLSIEQICNYTKIQKVKIQNLLTSMQNFSVVRKKGEYYLQGAPASLDQAAWRCRTGGSLKRRLDEVWEERFRFRESRERRFEATETGHCDLADAI